MPIGARIFTAGGFIKGLLRRPVTVVLVHLIVIAAVAPGLLRLTNDNSPDVFFSRDIRTLEQFDMLRQEFGVDHGVRIVVGGRGVWHRNALSWLGEMEAGISALPGVQRVVGLAAIHRWRMLDWPPEDIETYHQKLMKDGLAAGSGLLSPPGDMAGMLVVFSEISDQAQRELLLQLESLLSRPPEGISAVISGLPVLQLAMDRSLIKMVSRFLPLFALVAIIFPAVAFRRLRDVAIPLIFVGSVQVLLFGFMGYLGVKLNLVNVILAPLIFVISMATAVHILAAYRQVPALRGAIPESNPRQWILDTYRIKTRPVIWTGLTTLAAFGSLIFAGVQPIQGLGLWSGVGIAIMTLLAFTLYPVLLLAVMPVDPSKQNGNYDKRLKSWGRALASRAISYRKWVMALAFGFGVLAVLGIFRLGVDDNIGKYLSPDHPARMEMERLEKNGMGVFSAELVLSYRHLDPVINDGRISGFQNPVDQEKLSNLASLLRKKKFIKGVICSGDLVDAAVNEVLVEGTVTDSVRWLALGLLQSIPESRSLLHSLVTEDGGCARLTLLLPMQSYHEIQPLFTQIIHDAQRIFPHARIFITGQYPLMLKAQEKLVSGLIESLSVTLICIALVFFMLLGRPGITIKAMVPNIWPVLLVFGGMGWLGIPLDSVSVLTASIVLGLAVDDTFHTLGHYLEQVPYSDPTEAIRTTMGRTAPAHILTTLILTTGFAACIFSDLLPVSRMGLLASVAIVLALIGDLIIIPALFSESTG